ncbi:MAG TPA: C-GCAxxG-C-C family protein [Candidatus Gastranaerophilaceae bacterium]|nr:C-GCAxxG-C-C family protein [Candidatus Gastranaerophilaceae bacterium]HPT41710.1 C-GCAxxG-C-C family protein [Candidatus Gastranaerophilaceae bacterium]
MKNKASDYYKQGNSCSESIIKAAVDAGLCDESLLSVASAFSGGMSSGCLCGAVAGSQMVLGHNFGKRNSKNNQEIARQKAKEFIEEFKKNRKATCCKVLTAGLDPVQRKQNCTSLVEECAQILEKMIKLNTSS